MKTFFERAMELDPPKRTVGELRNDAIRDLATILRGAYEMTLNLSSADEGTRERAREWLSQYLAEDRGALRIGSPEMWDRAME